MLINMEMDSKTLVVDAHDEIINNNFCILICGWQVEHHICIPQTAEIAGI